jgi:hypothetical protein
MKLTARVNGPPRLTGSGLIVICSYRGGNENAQPRAFRVPVFWRVLNWVTLLQLRRFVAAMRDHFANPRNVEYQLEMADAIVSRSQFDAVMILADARLELSQDVSQTPAGREIAHQRLKSGHLDIQRHFDTIVLVYPDAVGLTWGGLERSASKIASTVIIANGRRRLLTWDRQIARSLGLRRFLSNTRLMECAWGVLIVPTAAVLAAFDFARGRV